MSWRVIRIDHVAVCVEDLDASVVRYREMLGLEPTLRGISEEQRTEAVLLPVGSGNLELITPRGNTGLEKFLEKRGPGLHHIAIEVEGIDAALKDLEARGVALIDRVPKRGARGHRVAFLHPKATGGVLIELVEPDTSFVG